MQLLTQQTVCSHSHGYRQHDASNASVWGHVFLNEFCNILVFSKVYDEVAVAAVHLACMMYVILKIVWLFDSVTKSKHIKG